MQSIHYTAMITHGKQILLKKDGWNAQHLLVTLLRHLQEDYSNANGIIIDNRLGKTIHRCRKTTCYD